VSSDCRVCVAAGAGCRRVCIVVCSETAAAEGTVELMQSAGAVGVGVAVCCVLCAAAVSMVAAAVPFAVLCVRLLSAAVAVCCCALYCCCSCYCPSCLLLCLIAFTAAAVCACCCPSTHLRSLCFKTIEQDSTTITGRAFFKYLHLTWSPSWNCSKTKYTTADCSSFNFLILVVPTQYRPAAQNCCE